MRFLLISTILSVAAAGCSSGHWVREESARSDDLEVYLEHRIEEDAVVAQGFDHPFTIGRDDLAAVLSSLLYWESSFLGKKKEEPVFKLEEVAELAPAIAAALGEAGPDERVYFTSRNWGGGLIFSNKRVTRGVAFVEPEGYLNLAFIEINEELYSPDYSQMGRNRPEREPTAITDSTRPLAALPWLSLRPVEGEDGVHPLWCVINAKEVRDALASTRVRPSSGEPKASEESAEAGAERVTTISGVKEKLKLLKDLFDEGLITEEEYAKKKAELLEDL